MKTSLIMVAGMALTASAALAQNTGGTLTSGTAMYRIGGAGTPALPTAVTSTGPTMDLLIPGISTADQVFSDWWWFRGANDTRENAINSATSRVFNASDATYGYNLSGGMTATLRYDFAQTSVTNAVVTQTFVVSNPGTFDASMSMFHYLDVALGTNGDATDGATLTTANNRMLIADGANTVDYLGVGANAYQVTNFATLRGLLTNTAVNNMDNTGLPYTGTDWTGGYQWNLMVPAGGSSTIVVSYGVNTPAIPAPGALALLGLGGLVAARRRRA